MKYLDILFPYMIYIYIIFVIFFILLYTTPSLIAFLRGHRNLIPIIIVNFLLSFTSVGYIISLIWCFSSNTKTRRTKLRDWQLFIIFFMSAIITFVLLTIIITQFIYQNQYNIIN